MIDQPMNERVEVAIHAHGDRHEHPSAVCTDCNGTGERPDGTGGTYQCWTCGGRGFL